MSGSLRLTTACARRTSAVSTTVSVSFVMRLRVTVRLTSACPSADKIEDRLRYVLVVVPDGTMKIEGLAMFMLSRDV